MSRIAMIIEERTIGIVAINIDTALSSGHPAEKKLVQQDGRVRKLSSWKPQESSGGSGSVFAKVVDFGLHK